MPLIRIIPDRYQKLIRELLAFGTAGAINTLLGTLIFNLILSVGALTATTVSTAVATGSSYLMNRHVTYRHRPRTTLRRELPMFVAFNVMALFLRLGIMATAKSSFSLETSDRLELNIVNAVGIVVGTVFLLVTYRTFVFKPETIAAPPRVAQAAPLLVAQAAPLLVTQAAPLLVTQAAPLLVAQAASPAIEADGFAELTGDLEAELNADAILDELLDAEDVAVGDARGVTAVSPAVASKS